ncbi:hypothetical protein SBOR_9905 [Sclerotinia borealis F-4128]|uniref:Uncharacterized protein n=1 Tax=Sclerotinia borealis (strain F-4128) TaxID=1432307 RepID=W9C1D5_SCLBF|nr:hypothetical protein SBOR_9905 [Sclerotinia borealis F-4128]
MDHNLPPNMVYANDADFQSCEAQISRMGEKIQEFEASAVRLVRWRNDAIQTLAEGTDKIALVNGNWVLQMWAVNLRELHISMEEMARKIGRIREWMHALVTRGFYKEEGIVHQSWPQSG